MDKMIGKAGQYGKCWCIMCGHPKSHRKKDRRIAKRRERQKWKKQNLVS